MKTRNDLWVWIDLEMTGLDLSKCVIVEIATVITDKTLDIIAKGPDIVIKRSKSDMAKIEEWPKKMHDKSGLLKSIDNSDIKLKEAEKITLDFISKYVEKNSSPLCWIANALRARTRASVPEEVPMACCVPILFRKGKYFLRIVMSEPQNI